MQVAPRSVADFEPVLEGKSPTVELQDSDFSSEFSMSNTGRLHRALDCFYEQFESTNECSDRSTGDVGEAATRLHTKGEY
jgi:hypothetical protein